jgi:hypothetical protein
VKWPASAAVALVLLTAACGGGDDDAGPTDVFTPAGTKEETPTPAPADGSNGGVAPAPSDPQLDEQLTEITAGELEAVVDPGSRYTIDGLQITQDAVGEAPPCANFAFDFTWQVQEPFPPDNVQIAWTFERMGGTVEIGQGPAGEQQVGCGVLYLDNNGSETVRVAIRYRVGAIQ